MIAVLVPVKRLGAGKSRLVPALSRDTVARLMLAMLEDLLDTLHAVPGLGPIAVVTEDGRVAEAAERAGAGALVLPDEGLNDSLDRAAKELDVGRESLLVVLGDVPAAEPRDIEALIAALRELGGRGAVLSPSRDGGSSALLRAPHDIIPSSFGPGSAERHREGARRAGIPFRELSLPSLAIDVDRAEDLDDLVARPRSARRTAALLRELGRGPRAK